MVLILDIERHENNRKALDKARYYKGNCCFCRKLTASNQCANYIIELYGNDIYLCKTHLIQLTKELITVLYSKRWFFGKCITLVFYDDVIYLKKKEATQLLDTLLEYVSIDEIFI